MAAKVLLLEDDPQIAELVSLFLPSSDYDLSYALTFATAVDALLKDKPDVVLLNILFPDVPGGTPTSSGLILLKLIRSQWPSIKVILFTGLPDKAFEAGQLGAFGYVSKGQGWLEELSNVLRSAVGMSGERSGKKMGQNPSENDDSDFTLIENVERNAIVNMLKETNGNKLETAKRLGIGRQTLYNKIKAYGIEA